jgi:ABC-type multidrug transport system permease subunit
MKVYNNINTVLRWVILAFIIYQGATSAAGMWIALIISFFILRFVLRLFISTIYLFCMAFIFIVLLSLLII